MIFWLVMIFSGLKQWDLDGIGDGPFYNRLSLGFLEPRHETLAIIERIFASNLLAWPKGQSQLSICQVRCRVEHNILRVFYKQLHRVGFFGGLRFAIDNRHSVDHDHF